MPPPQNGKQNTRRVYIERDSRGSITCDSNTDKGHAEFSDGENAASKNRPSFNWAQNLLEAISRPEASWREDVFEIAPKTRDNRRDCCPGTC